jgi:putative membrane protein
MQLTDATAGEPGSRPGSRPAESPNREPAVLLALLLTALVVSGIAPKDRRTWLLEEAPVFLAVPVLIATYRRFRMTPLSYRLIFLHALLLVVGGHYTFSKVPAGLWLQDALDLARNDYDRVVHFVGGFAPAVVAREILLRKTRLRPGGWLFCLVTSACLAGSAFYELLEWWAAKLTGVKASAFLATQGDVWDTQWDMLLGFIGAIAGQLLLARRQDQELAALQNSISMREQQEGAL